MISAKEAKNISFIYGKCGEYLDSIEKDIIKAAKAGRYDVSIQLVSFGIDIASDDSHEIVVAIIDYLRNLGYNASVAKKLNGYYASLLVSWVKPLEKEQKNKED